jgi:hypothetical protein
MSDYNIQISWSGKDNLPDSDPAKVISGNDFNLEFTAIQTAINSKPETNEILNAVYPVGSIYINAINSTNPASLLGFGTWTAFGAGRVPVGFDASDSDFDTAEETGGSKDAIVVAHTHTGSTASDSHQHYVAGGTYSSANSGNLSSNTTKTLKVGDNLGGNQNQYHLQSTTATADAGLTNSDSHSHTVTVDSTGSSGTNANLQPYITVYMWKRTA